MTTPLVADAPDPLTETPGPALLDDARLIADGIRGHNWVDTTLGGVGASLDALSLAVDPLGTLAAWGVTWLLEHVGPLRDALDRLAGDAGEVAAHAATWSTVAATAATAGQHLADRLRTDVAGWHGMSGDAYRAHAGEHLDTLAGISAAAGGIAAAVDGAGLLVALVRGIVRDLIAQFVATLAARLPQWLAAEGLTLGLATPVVVSQVSGLVARYVDEIRHFVRALLGSLRRLRTMIDRLGQALDRLGKRITGRGGSTSPGRPHPPGGSGEKTGGTGEKPQARGSTPQAFVDSIVDDPRSLVGHSAQSIADQFTAAGYAAVVRQSTKKGTSGRAVQVRVQGHPEITNIQVHPGGGRHTPEGSPYWKISTNTGGRTWVIPRDFRGADELSGNVVRYDG